MKTILLSIHKEPFEALLDGRKHHEFRRRFYLDGPFQVVFYVSSPVKAICGVGIFESPVRDSIKNLARLIKTHSFSSPESLRSYFEGLEQGYALPVRKIKKIDLISLSEIRDQIPGFRPPQSYCYFNFDIFRQFLKRLDLYEMADEIV